MDSNTRELDIVPQFQEVYLRYLQENQNFLHPSEFKDLYERYLARNAEPSSSAAQQKILEQIMLAIPLWLLTRPPAGNVSSLEYIRLIHDISDDLLAIHTRIKSSFGFES